MKKWHLWLAASIGLVVIAGMMIREFDINTLSKIRLSSTFFLGIGLAVVLFAIQNLMFTLRYQHLCDGKGWNGSMLVREQVHSLSEHSKLHRFKVFRTFRYYHHVGTLFS